MTYEKQQINRIFLGGDENKIGWHDRQLGKELHFNLGGFSQEGTSCEELRQSMLGRGNSPPRAWGLD